MPDPGRAFAAHVGVACAVGASACQPPCCDSRCRASARLPSGTSRRGVVRAARAERTAVRMGCSTGGCAGCCEGRSRARRLIGAVSPRRISSAAIARATMAVSSCTGRWRQRLAGLVASCRRCGPPRRLAVIEQLRGADARQVTLLLDDQNVFEAFGESACAMRLQRPRQADLVERMPSCAARASAMPRSRSACRTSQISLAGGEDAQPRFATHRSPCLVDAVGVAQSACAAASGDAVQAGLLLARQRERGAVSARPLAHGRRFRAS